MQRLGFDLQLVDTSLDDVADADDAHQAAVVDHRDVADAALGHELHELVDRRPQTAGGQLGAHEIADGAFESAGAIGGERSHNIALGDDARHIVPPVGHHQGPDVVLLQNGYSLTDGDVAGDGHDVCALVLENVLDQHLGHLLGLGEGACPGPRPLLSHTCMARWEHNRLQVDDSVFDAGTVVLVRDAEPGVQCLMLRKTEGQAFGGLWVFPGGRVEAADGTGLEGARRAAVRETAEETGLQLEADTLVPLAHWIPPLDTPRRYLTWFFVAPVPGDAAEVIIDGGEIGDHVWTRPAEALERHARREIKLIPPTWMTLHWMSQHDDVASTLRVAAHGPVERFATHMVDGAGGLVALWEPDVAYPSGGEAPGDLDASGPRHRLYMGPAGWRYQRT